MASLNAAGSCLARIRARLRDESKSAVKIARFILRSPSRARNMSIGALADACGTSTATVSRFCTGLGYAGYREFQLDLATALAQTGPVTLDSLVAGAAPRAIIQRVFECSRQSLSETEKMLDGDVLIRVARLLQRAKRIFFLGIGGSGLMAREAAERFMSLGLTAIAITDPYEQIFATANLGRSDVMIGISHTGQTAHVTEAIRTARRRGARTVALTNYPQSPLSAASEFRLITAFREHHINAAVSSSRIAQMCVIDSLYFIVGGWGRRGARRLADEAEDRVQKMLRRRPTRRGNPSRKEG